MKIRDGGDEPDIFGEYPAAWITKSKELINIQEWLYRTYQGYKFAIIFDTTKDEYQEPENIPVYFIDNILTELMEYIGINNVKEWIAEKEKKGAAN